ncbi:MAG: Histidine kinase [Nocardioides sp.]|nr:Histidine kinase [Nocardioides sp.]
MVVASGLLAILVGTAFAALLVAITNFRAATDHRRDTREELVAAEALEKLVIDLETGLRGFVITREERFLEPWTAARAALPEAVGTLERLASDNSLELARVRRIVQAVTAYVQQYAVPLVAAVRRNDAFAHSVEATDAGRRRIDALRGSFDRFSQAGRADLDARETAADEAASRATVAAGLGVAGSIILIFAFTGYLARVIVRPLRRAALMAERLARGDLDARLAETDVAEIGALEQSFNVMASSLQKSGDEVALLLAEQAALRRVATLVAQGVPADDIFAAVTEEVGRLFSADQAAVGRFEPDRSAIVVVGVGQDLEELPVGMRWEFDDSLASTAVLRTGRAARRDAADWEDASGAVAERVRRMGIRSTVACPIVVEGHLWGVMVVSTKREPLSPDTEERLANFTELIATAVANAESRAQLTASRARIVAASDHARHRIERDLHDGAQQRLVTLGLRLRGAALPAPSELAGQGGEWSWVVEELMSVIDDLREISSGIHPAVLAEGGLGPALRTLARRSAVPVEVDVQPEMRFPEPIELAAYYVASEALTNAVKHGQASAVSVSTEKRDDILHLWVRDDGIGGADPSRGSGIVGVKDRVEALGGRISLVSKPGEGTTLHVQLPVDPGAAPAPSNGAPTAPRAASTLPNVDQGEQGRPRNPQP